MTDFEIDCAQKKQIANNAFRKKGRGDKGFFKNVNNMTDAELRAKNGEVKTVKMNEPMTWDEFKKLGADIQKEYLSGLIDRYGVGMNSISIDLFGLAGPSLYMYCEKKGIKIDGLSKARRANKDGRKVWETFCGVRNAKSETECTPGNEEKVKANPVVDEPVYFESSGLDISLRIMNATDNAIRKSFDDLVNAVLTLGKPCGNYEISIKEVL